MKKIRIAAMILFLSLSIMSCGEYFEEESKIIIDYRHNDPYIETRTSGFDDDKSINTYYHPETWELLYEITYADGHKERRWQDCTRFEYNNAKIELGD